MEWSQAIIPGISAEFSTVTVVLVVVSDGRINATVELRDETDETIALLGLPNRSLIDFDTLVREAATWTERLLKERHSPFGCDTL